MKRLRIFLNELSLGVDPECDSQEVLRCVLETLDAIKSIKKLRQDLVVSESLLEIQFASGRHTLASLLRGADYRDEWRFLSSLEQASPVGYDDAVPAFQIQEVRFQDSSGKGLLLAVRNSSAVLSFALRAAWKAPSIVAEYITIDESEIIVSTNIIIPNLATQEHVTVHMELIENYGRELSTSSIIHRGEGFVARMYFNDHNPPHFHVMLEEDSSETAARFAIETLDLLDQSESFRSPLRRRVLEWATGRRDMLMKCWLECRRHRHPQIID